MNPLNNTIERSVHASIAHLNTGNKRLTVIIEAEIENLRKSPLYVDEKQYMNLMKSIQSNCAKLSSYKVSSVSFEPVDWYENSMGGNNSFRFIHTKGSKAIRRYDNNEPEIPKAWIVQLSAIFEGNRLNGPLKRFLTATGVSSSVIATVLKGVKKHNNKSYEIEDTHRFSNPT